MDERRRAERFPLTIPIELKDGKGVTRDVSGLGVYFSADFPFEVNQEIDFLLRVPDAVRVRCWGRIVRVDPEDGRYGVAVTIDDFAIDESEVEISEPHLVVQELRKHHTE